MANQKPKHPHDALIDKLGGTNKAAELFDVKPPSVSAWRKTGLPKPRLMYLKVVRPDLFPSAGKPRKKAEPTARP